MRIEQVQVSTQNVKKGMYVCKLDRPWITTPFPFQGFVIRGPKDIEDLKAHCEFVFVDVNRGVAPDPEDRSLVNWRKNQQTEATRAPVEPISAKRLKIKRDTYKAPKPMRREVKRARIIHQELTRAVSNMLTELRLGKALDIMETRATTGKMIQSIIRSPNAFVWLLKLRDQDDYTYGHAIRSAVLSVVVGRNMGLEEDQLNDLALGTMLCDVGKIRMSKTLLNKRDALTTEEWKKLQSHVQEGVKLLKRCNGINERVIKIVACHHERYDGSGYPRGLQGDQIPPLARIAALADSYDAMTSVKPYTDAQMTPAEAMEYFYDNRDILFQNQLVQEFIRAIGIYPTGSLVRLSNGEIAMVLNNVEGRRLHPKVLVIRSAYDRDLAEAKVVELQVEDKMGNTRTYADVAEALVPEEHGVDVKALMEEHEQKQWSFDKIRNMILGAA